MSGSHCSLSAATKDQMEQRQPRFGLVCTLLRVLFLSSSSRPKASSGMRNSCYALEPAAQEEEPEVGGRGEEEETEEVGGEKKLEEVVEERGGTGDVAATTLRRSVKQLHFGGWEEKEEAAAEIKRIVRKDGRARRSLAALGVIPSLVSMLDSAAGRRRLAVQALIELANGSFTNKALMAEAGVLKRLPRLIMDARDPFRRKECLECLVLLLSVSSLAKTQFHVAAGDVLPPLIEILDHGSAVDELKLTCLGTLCNLSAKLGNARTIVSGGAVRALVRLSREKSASEIALAALGNLVVTATGMTAIEEDEMVPGALFEVMAWEDKPRSRELAVYVMMVLAGRSAMQRRKMAESGLVPLLLEVALLGTQLARRRALKTLQWFKVDGQTNMAGHLRQQARRSALWTGETRGFRKDMERMVRQSLHKNMECITRRAAVPADASVPTNLVVHRSTETRPCQNY